VDVTASSVDDRAALIEQLRSLTKDVHDEVHAQGKAAHQLARLSRRLTISAAVGAAAVGLVTALTQTLHGTARVIVTLVAFAGAATSGTAAALKAPERAHGAQGRWIEFRSLARRLDAIMTAGLGDRSLQELKSLIDEVLDRLDQIQGASESQNLRLTAEDEAESALPQPAPKLLPGASG